MKVKINLDGLGIIEGDQKRLLENYVDERLLVQRKQYDEYYVQLAVLEIDIYIRDLMILAEKFKVTVLEGSVTIE